MLSSVGFVRHTFYFVAAIGALISVAAHAETWWCMAEDQRFEEFVDNLKAVSKNANLPSYSSNRPVTIYVSPAFKYNEGHYGKDVHWIHTPFANYLREKYQAGVTVDTTTECFATSQHGQEAALQGWGTRAPLPNIVPVDRPNDGDYSQ